MGNRGPKPKGKVQIKWSAPFAYAIGLLTADGCLSKDRRHIDLTSKDRTQIIAFKKCLNLDTKISPKFSGFGNMAFHTQFGDVLFYRFLEGIGLTSAKSKTLGALLIPRKFFFDFLRGYFDGDGSSFSYYDPVFKDSYRFYISFGSASLEFLEWLKKKLTEILNTKGSIGHNRAKSYFQLRFSKKEAVLLGKKIYKNKTIPRLERKHLKIEASMRIIEPKPGW